MKKNISELYTPEMKSNVTIDGISLHSALADQNIEIAVKGAITSFDPECRIFMNNIISIFIKSNELKTINKLLVQIKSDNTAYIYRDFPYAFKVYLASSKEKGSAIFQHEVTDIESIHFEDDFSKIEYDPSDKIIYLFRSNWNFGLYYNFRKCDSMDQISREIAYLYKLVEYRDVFNFIHNEDIAKTFLEDGWFPFNALIRYNYFERLIFYYSNGKKNYADLELLKSAFTKELITKITERWWSNPVFESKKQILNCGIEAFLRHDQDGYITSIKVLVTEIEGIIRNAFKETISNRQLRPFLDELESQGSTKYFSKYSLVFPYGFIYYLRKSIFANFEFSDDKVPQSRHAYSHGVADLSKYSWERSLQIILTIDQMFMFL